MNTPAVSRQLRGSIFTLGALTLFAWALVAWSILNMDKTIVAWMMPMTAVWSPHEAIAVWLMWAVMMGAMMLPSASQVVLLHNRISLARTGTGAETNYFIGAYLLAWAMFSIAAAGAQWLLQTLGVLSHMLVITSNWFAAAILVMAGLYQFTPLKDACLRKCRSPAGFFMTGWRAGKPGAFRMGLHHGVYCIGCCWAMMAILFVFGVMNLAVIVLLASGVAVEKLLPYGWLTGRALGAGAIGWGAWLALL